MVLPIDATRPSSPTKDSLEWTTDYSSHATELHFYNLCIVRATCLSCHENIIDIKGETDHKVLLKFAIKKPILTKMLVSVLSCKTKTRQKKSSTDF